MGQGPTDIAVDNPSAKAYVLADGGDVISIIDLSTLTVERVLNVANVTSIALTPDDFRLLALSQNGLRNFRTADLEEISSVDARAEFFTDGEVLPFPNSTQAFARNSSGRSPNTSEIFDLDLRTATIVGDVGAERFVEVMILNNERAIGLFNRTGELADIDLTTSPAVVEIFPFAQDTKNISLSPNKRFLYAASLDDASVTKIDLETDTVRCLGERFDRAVSPRHGFRPVAATACTDYGQRGRQPIYSARHRGAGTRFGQGNGPGG